MIGNANDFFIWGIDDVPYGPVELSALAEWVKDERVLADTWIFARRDGSWRRAADIADLKPFFKPAGASSPRASGATGLPPGSLRRIKILADLNDAQLDRLTEFMDVQRVPQWSQIVNQGDPGDAMYMVMDGELRARVMVGGQEKMLATFGVGDFFGDISLFDHGPRSADVVANKDCTLLKMSTVSFDRLMREAPGLATPFLQATSRTLAARIRADNQRLGRLEQLFGAM